MPAHTAPPPKVAIRQYGLYGEMREHPDVMHCEPLAERSSLHDWEMEPHRHERLHQVLLLTVGSGTAWLEGRAIPLVPSSLVNIPRGSVHAFRYEPGSDGLVVMLADTLVDELRAREPAVRTGIDEPWVDRSDDALDRTLALLAAEYTARDATRAVVLKGLCDAMLAMAARRRLACRSTGEGLADSSLHFRFEALLEQRFRDHWRVADYARELAVSPTHLTRVVRARTGQPASRQIDARVIREARRLLVFTNLRVTSISHTLGFADPALFSRVFARVMGCSPRAFRQQATGTDEAFNGQS